MKNFAGIVVVLIALILGSCKQCPKRKGLKDYWFLDKMNSYFGMYQSDNWWVYKNNKSTKTDSVFITYFSEVIRKDKQVKCITYPERKFTLNTNYINDGINKEINGEYFNNANCCENYFLCVIGAKMDAETDIHPLSTIIPSEVVLDSITVSGSHYQNAIYFQNGPNKLLFAPDIGIIRYINSTDTFNLVKYFIK